MVIPVILTTRGNKTKTAQICTEEKGLKPSSRQKDRCIIRVNGNYQHTTTTAFAQ